jgi:hypothetical protein
MDALRKRVWAALVLAAALGCEGEPTEIMAEVHYLFPRDPPNIVVLRVFSMPADVPAMDDALVEGPRRPRVDLGEGAVMTLDGRYYVHRFTGVFDARSSDFPLEVGIVPRGGDPSRIVYLEAFALDCPSDTAGGEACTVVAETVARTAFVPGKLVGLVLVLSASCRSVRCPTDYTCRFGACGRVDRPCIDETPADPGSDPFLVCDAGPALDGGPTADAGPTLPDASCSGECVPGQTEDETQACGRCDSGTRTRSRACGPDCTWGAFGAFGACTGESGCSPGDTRSSGCTREVCNSSCDWADGTECRPDDCTTSGCPAGAFRCCERAACTWYACCEFSGSSCVGDGECCSGTCSPMTSTCT